VSENSTPKAQASENGSPKMQASENGSPKKDAAKAASAGKKKKGAAAQQPERPKMTPEEVLKRKQIEIANPMAIVIAPKTREGHALVRIAMRYDKVINRLRMNGGTSVPINKVMSCLTKAREFHLKMQSILASLSDGQSVGYFMVSQMDTPDSRLLLIQQRTSYVYLPSSSEGREILHMIKRMDPMLVQYRTTCEDYEKVGQAVRIVLEAVTSFDSLMIDLSKTANVPYESPKNMGWLQKQKEQEKRQSAAAASPA